MRKDFTSNIEYQEKYQNNWVVLDKKNKKILAFGKNLNLLIKKVNTKGKEYILEKVLPINSAFIPWNS